MLKAVKFYDMKKYIDSENINPSNYAKHKY